MPSGVPLEAGVPTSPITTHRRASLKILSRNIDKVALGNLKFSTWYYSPYPDSIIHGLDQAVINTTNSSANTGSQTAVHAEGNQNHAGGIKHERKQVPHSATTSTNGIIKQQPSRSTGSVDHTGSTHSSLVGDKGIIDTLHVCPYCFRYTPSATSYAVHVTLHQKKESDYYGSLRTSFSSPKAQRHKGRSTRRDGDEEQEREDEAKDEGAPRPVPDTAVKVYSHGGYTVWDIDGEVEKLYCQNLSLFGKLFLEQKSVFFDTAGFHYFVLTYCPSSNPQRETEGQKRSRHSAAGKKNIQDTNQKVVDGNKNKRKSSKLKTTATTTTSPLSATGKQSVTNQNSSIDHDMRQREKGRKEKLHQQLQQQQEEKENKSDHTNIPTLNNPHQAPSHLRLQYQVLGFFSKENLSWDSNNLACILVFPPYQHRNLGQLLMSISYKLSGWEWEDSIIGGPEKPLSSMGKRSYVRFWSERVARFVLGQSADAEGLKVFEEQVVDVDEDGDLVVTGKRCKRKRGKGWLRDEFTVKELGDRTGMLPEDVVAALIEMGIGIGVGNLVGSPTATASATITTTTTDNASAATIAKWKRIKDDSKVTGTSTTAITPSGTAIGSADVSMNMGIGMGGHGGDERDGHPTTSMTVQRSQVLDWARRHNVDLVSAVKEEGFLGEWALSDDDDEDNGEDEDTEGDQDTDEADDDEAGSEDGIDSD